MATKRRSGTDALRNDACVKLSRADYERLIQVAQEQQCPRSAVLRNALLWYLDSFENLGNLTAVG